MADASYWADLLNSPLGAKLREQGAAAMASGAVSPEEAQNAISPLLRVAGVGKKNAILAAARKSRAAAVPSVGAGMELPEVSLPGVPKGSGLGGEEQVKGTDSAASTVSNKDVAQALQFMTPTQLFDQYRSTANLPTFQEQEEGIKKSRDLMAIAAQAPSDVFSGPIAGLLQAEFGRNTGTMAAQKGETPAAQRNNILAMTGKIQDDQRDLSKSIFDAIGKERSGYTMTTIADQLALKSIIDQLSKRTEVDPAKFEKKPGGGKGYDPTKDIKELGKQRAISSTSMLNSLDQIDQLLKEDGGIAGLAKNSKGLKGVGGLNQWVPIGLRGDKQAELYNLALDLTMSKLQMRSGAQASEKEAARYLQQLGLTPTSSAREMAKGVVRMTNDLRSYLSADEARFRPEAVNKYASTNGAITSAMVDKYLQSAPPSPTSKGKTAPAPAPQRKKELKDMTKAELDAYEAQLTGKGAK